MQPDPVAFPAPDPLVVKIFKDPIFVHKETKLRIWGVTFGGEDVRIRARAVARKQHITTIIEGIPIGFPIPPADFGFDFTGLPVKFTIQIVVDAFDKAGRVARDVINLYTAAHPSAFDISLDAVDIRSDSCDVNAYGTANVAGSTVDTPTDITAPGHTVNGTDSIPNEWWDWAVKYAVPATFPQGAATLRVKRTIIVGGAPQSDSASQNITIGPCGEPEEPDTNETG